MGEGFSEFSGRGRISLQSPFQTQSYDAGLLIGYVDLSLENVPVVVLKPGPPVVSNLPDCHRRKWLFCGCS